MKKNKYERIQEVLSVLGKPQQYSADFFIKHADDKEMMDLYEEMRKYKEAGLSLNAFSDPDVNLQWNKLNRKIQTGRNTWTVFTAIAASVVILFTIGILLTTDWSADQTSQMSQNKLEIIPGDSRAVLITSDGQESFLDTNNSVSIQEKLGVNIVSLDRNTISYQAGVGEDTLLVKDAYNTIKIPRAGEYRLVLADGTKVRLNSETELKYPLKFAGKQREVELIAGEAYFDVVSNPEKPFVVRSKNVDTRVLGTQFNVSAYPEEDLNITLVEGKVSLNNNLSKQEHVLVPGENAKLKDNDTQISIVKVDVKKYVSWIDGYFYFEKERLEDILVKLERWYDFKVFYQNPKVKDYEFRMRADRNLPFNVVLDRLEMTGRIKIEINGRALLVSDVQRLEK
ncbi:FecR domain-containing protein [Ancylomarina sp. DW003]|nr:FecR family protein [Ancylomarina sp. DW003]MDE5423902.1 FecR domain-containing protein [Ancylomarina sp. DW003]